MAAGPSSIGILVNEIEKSQSLQDAIKIDPIAGINRAAQEVQFKLSPASDKFTFRLVVVVLSAVILFVLCLIGYGYIKSADGNITVPDFLVAVGSTALGALAGILAPTPTRST